MNLSKSPSLKDHENYKKNEPDEPGDGEKSKIFLYSILLVAILLIGATLQFMPFIQNAQSPSGTGVIKGLILHESGQPFDGEVYILETNTTTPLDANGFFEIQAPAQSISLYLMGESIAQEYLININANQVYDMGTVTFPSHLEELP